MALFGLVFCWDQRPRPKSVNFGLSPVLRLTNHRVIADVIGDSSLISPYFFIFELAKNEVISLMET